MRLTSRDVAAVAVIWIVVIAGVVVLVVGADDDPETKTDWAGAGQLTGLLGGVLTAAYFSDRKRRAAARGTGSPPTAAEEARLRRLARLHWKEIAIVLGLWLLATILLAAAGVGLPALFGAMLPSAYIWLRDRKAS